MKVGLKRGGEARYPAGLITPRSVVQIHPPLPTQTTILIEFYTHLLLHMANLLSFS